MNRRSLRKFTVLAVLCAALGVAAWSEDIAAYNDAGVKAYERGDYEQAISYFHTVYGKVPDNLVVRRNLCNANQALANACAQKGDFKRAVKCAENAADAEPGNVSPLIQAGAYYLRLEDINAAIAKLEKAITTKPGDLDAHELLGYAYYRDNDLSSARAQWDYVLEVNPKRPGLREQYDKAFREESVEGDFDKYKSRHFQISYPPDVPREIRTRVLNILDRAYISIGRELGGVFPPAPIYVVLYLEGQFSEATRMAEYVGAVYDGKIRSPLTDTKGVWLSAEEMRLRLTHEYVHVVVNNIAGRNVPWWVNEGLAQTLSNPLSSGDTARLQKLYRDGQALHLKDLEPQEIPKMSREQLGLAYLQAHAVIESLWNRYGETKMLQLLHSFAEGVKGEEGLKKSYRKTYEQLERDTAAAYQ